MATVFVVEDDLRLLDEVRKILEGEGFDFATCIGFKSIADQVISENPDCVVLDIMIPGTDGRMVAREIRRASDVPIIMLTCLDSEFDEVSAMDSGADDYLTKPYRPAVLVAHIRAALRRRSVESRLVISHGGVTLDIGSGTLTGPAGECLLTRNEARILALLLRNAGRVVSRQDIMCELWESDAFVDDNTLTVNVNRLRKGLASVGAAEDFIKTRRGEGYLA